MTLNENLQAAPQNTLCFTGHRSIPLRDQMGLRKKLDQVIVKAISDGFRSFLYGGALGFDTMAAEAVLRLQKSHPEIRLILVAPCKGQASRWSRPDQIRYEAIAAGAAQRIALSDQYYPGCMLTRNRFMVDHASLCVCYLSLMKGGTWQTVRYALEMNLPIINLAFREPLIQGQMKEGSLWNSMFIYPSAKRNACTAISLPMKTGKRKWTAMCRR